MKLSIPGQARCDPTMLSLTHFTGGVTGGKGAFLVIGAHQAVSVYMGNKEQDMSALH